MLDARAVDVLPRVDVSALAGSDSVARRAVAGALDEAARTHGFFYVEGHGLAQTLSDDLLQAAHEFFRLPQSSKLRYYIGDSKNHRGYVPPGEEVFYGGSQDTKEAFDLSLDLPADDPDYLAGNRLLGPNRWPVELPRFRERVDAYYGAITALGRRLVRGFALALELPEAHFDRLLVKPPSQLRLIHYPHRPELADAPGIGTHTDYECFTILLASAPGLEVLSRAERWIDAPPLPGCFVVNIGDLFEVLSNGRWVSTAHRVRRVPAQRFSAPLFFNLDYDAEVAPLPHLVEQDGAARYPRVLAGEHLLSQTIQSFSYLKRELELGRVRLPEGALSLASFAKERAERARDAAESAS